MRPYTLTDIFCTRARSRTRPDPAGYRSPAPFRPFGSRVIRRGFFQGELCEFVVRDHGLLQDPLGVSEVFLRDNNAARSSKLISWGVAIKSLKFGRHPHSDQTHQC